MVRLSVDTGGTFTDFVWLDEDGRFRIYKQLSTPDDPSKSILAGVDFLELPPESDVVHGSTVATNALLERRGARTALISTVGFTDVLEIGRQNRPELYALVPQKPAPLVPRAWRFGVDERVTATGEVLRALAPDSLEWIVAQLEAEQVESVAVCLLFSFLYPDHEQQIRDALLSANGTSGKTVHVSLSVDILPEYREYERTATTVINAYVAPLMDRYLRRLAAALAPRPLTIMQSNGGVINAAVAGAQAARTVLSGPAGGVVGARYVAARAGFEQVITFDMGGTSTDVALCPGRLPTTAVGEIAGMPLRLPIIDIHTVGAGGGSLAYVDAGGALHVGPQSAGADPGPVCYGVADNARLPPVQGQPLPFRVTTTDANLVLGRLDAEHFLGGRMKLDEEAAAAQTRHLAAAAGASTVEAAALDVVQVANANMERAIRRISVERGYDPRDFTLVAFGGAGPLHACELAENLQIPRVLVPPVAGVLSALGMLVAAPTKDYSQTVMVEVGELDSLSGHFKALQERALAEMALEGHRATEVTVQHALDMRYTGQSHELTIPVAPEEPAARVSERFHRAHMQRYGYARAEAAVEVVNLRLSAAAAVEAPLLASEVPGPEEAAGAQIGRKAVWFGGQSWPTTLYRRELLAAGHRFDGPAVVFQYDTTTVVPPGWQLKVDSFRNLVLERPRQ